MKVIHFIHLDLIVDKVTFDINQYWSSILEHIYSITRKWPPSYVNLFEDDVIIKSKEHLERGNRKLWLFADDFDPKKTNQTAIPHWISIALLYEDEFAKFINSRTFDQLPPYFMTGVRPRHLRFLNRTFLHTLPEEYVCPVKYLLWYSFHG